MTTILIARHGNTFAPGDLVVRVGLRSDLPLVASGQQQARNLGLYLKASNTKLAAVFSSSLRRTYETASLALETANIKLPIIQADIFNEIDYGPDEAQPEAQVIARIGQEAITAWDRNATVPPGWLVDPQLIIHNWQNFAQDALIAYPGQTILVVTSNGIARFAPYLTQDFENFSQNFKIKLATGALCSLSNTNGSWEVDYWNRAID